MKELLEIVMKLLGQNQGAAVLFGLCGVVISFASAKTVLDVRYIRLNMASKQDLALHRAEVEVVLTSQAFNIERDYVRKDICTTMMKGKSNGGATRFS